MLGHCLSRRAVRLFAGTAALLLGAAASGVAAGVDAAAPNAAWNAGAYSFSDELGGFRITGVAGIGTAQDPIVIEQELYSASPVTVVIRARSTVQPYGATGLTSNGFLHLRAAVRNASGLAWVEFGFELQEILGKPSVFGDGLSFDQRKAMPGAVSASTFAGFSRDFEPFDRLLFRDGKVDPAQTAVFGFPVTDYTPRQTFFLVEDPRIPSS